MGGTTKITGKITQFRFRKGYVCKECNRLMEWKESKYVCPECGTSNWRQRQRVYYMVLWLNDVYDRKIFCAAGNKSTNRFLNYHLGVSLREIKDELKGLRKLAYHRTWKRWKTGIEERVKKYFIDEDRIVAFKGETIKRKDESSAFIISGVASIYKRDVGEQKRFVEAKYRSLLEVAENILSDHEETVEMWGNIPIIRYTKTLDGENIEIKVTAPVKEYGKAYKIWMRVNDVHMYPADYVLVAAGRKKSWVYRVYHTQGWRENLTKRLEKCRELEERAVRIVESARQIKMEEASRLVNDCPELFVDEANEIIDEWTGGSLWDLVVQLSEVREVAGLWLLKQFSFLADEKSV